MKQVDLTVHYFCAALGRRKSDDYPDAPEWRSVDRAANAIKMMLKGKSNKYWPLRAKTKAGIITIDQADLSPVSDAILDWMLELLYHEFGYQNRVALVSIPSAGAVGQPDPQDRNARFIESMQLRNGGATSPFIAVNCLYWLKPTTKSHEGGTRDAASLYENLGIIQGSLDGFDAIVLFDDVHTTGGHLQAAARRIADSIDAGTDFDMAICPVRILIDPIDDPFDVATEQVDTDWLDFSIRMLGPQAK